MDYRDAIKLKDAMRYYNIDDEYYKYLVTVGDGKNKSYEYVYTSPEDVSKMKKKNVKKVDDVIEQISDEVIKIKVKQYIDDFIRELEECEEVISSLREEQKQLKEDFNSFKKSMKKAMEAAEKKVETMMADIRRFEIMDFGE